MKTLDGRRDEILLPVRGAGSRKRSLCRQQGPVQAMRGAALVELALVLPVLIFLVLGCVDFGRFATYYTAVTNAAREGASFGSQHPFTSNTHATWKHRLTEAVSDEMEGVPGFVEERLTVSEPTLIASHLDSRVRVKVSYTFEPAIRWPGLPAQLHISRTAEMPVIR